MPAPDGTISIALDFDGSLVEANVSPPRWRPRAREFIVGAATAGARLWLYSCRCAIACGLPGAGPWDADDFWRSGRLPADIEMGWSLFEEMRTFLEAEGVWTLMTPWTLPGKPLADIYADDKAEPPDWSRLASELGVRLAHAIQGGPGATVPQPAAPGTAGAPGGGAPRPARDAPTAAPGLRLRP